MQVFQDKPTGDGRFIVNTELGRLEEELGAFLGPDQHCVLMDKPVEGLTRALQASGVGEGERVLCTSLGFSYTYVAINRAGALPMFVDINPNTFNVDPYCLEYVIRKCQRERKPVPKVLVAVDLFGLPCDYKSIGEICAHYGITLIEDMSGAFGASLAETGAGSFGRFSIASFFAASPLGGLGDDVAVFCRSAEDAELLRELRSGGALQSMLDDCAVAEQIGRDMAQTKLISEKLKCYHGELARRNQVAAWYRERLKGAVRVQRVPEGYRSAYTQFIIALDGIEERAAVMDALMAEHIPCAIYHPVPLHQMAKGFDRIVLVNAERACQRLLSLPMHPYLSESVVDYICACVRGALEKHKGEEQEEAEACAV